MTTIRLGRTPNPTDVRAAAGDSHVASRRRWMTQLRSQMHGGDHASTLATRGSRALASVGRQKQLAVMFPLSPAEVLGLSEELAPEWSLVDSRAVEEPDAVLLPPCSWQTTAAVRTTFPKARLIVVDPAIDGPRSLVDGPVHRALTAGADLYTFEGRRLRPERSSVPPRTRASSCRRYRRRRLERGAHRAGGT